MALVSIIPMVILLNDIPEQIDWYRGKQLVGLKITTIDPWTTIRSIKKNANALTNFYGSKENVPPVLVIYTDGGPEHRSMFLSVKLAVVAYRGI